MISRLFKFKINKWLKSIYLLFYLKLCISIAYIYLFKNLNTYTNFLDVSNLNVNKLKLLINIRGIVHNYNEKDDLKSLVKNSGNVIESELENSNLVNNNQTAKIFNSAGEFLESVEDSRDSVWLVQIVMKADKEEVGDQFVNNEVWSKLSQLSRFGILTGIFNCENDYHFCQLKGWHKPLLVLGMVKYDNYRYPKEFVELFLYQNSKRNKYEFIIEWVEMMLRNRLYNHQNYDDSRLKLYYIQNETSATKNDITRVPLYYSSLSVKFNQRAKFHLIKSDQIGNNNNDLLLYKLCFNQRNSNLKDKLLKSPTPIYLIIDDQICYSYGSKLNELPNYQNLNQFLLFLYPDMNNLFSISFLFLNAYLIMFFFQYNSSLLKQLCRGLIYLCLCNFVLFSIWLLTINTNSKEILKVSSIINTSLNRSLIWLRYIFMYNDITQHLISYIRFLVFFYVFIHFYLAVFIYIFFCSLYYIHTRYVFNLKHKSNLNSISLINNEENNILNETNKNNETKKSKLKSFFLLPVNKNNGIRIEINNNDRNSSNLNGQNQLRPIRSQSPDSVDIDLDISVSELINQINGLTTIWLHSSTYADKLISELPSIEYCKCFYINTIRVHALDETDKDETTDDDMGANEYEDTKLLLKKSTSCKQNCGCGKNQDLKLYLNKNDLDLLWSKFSRSCSICLEHYKFGCLIALLPCGHLFHRKCIYEWFMSSVKYQCPCCRTSFYKFKKIL
jgi:E3 ubiquitin-protein ligase RNF103